MIIDAIEVEEDEWRCGGGACDVCGKVIVTKTW